MSYFTQFPYILYPNFSDKNRNTTALLKDLTVRVVRKLSPTDDESLYYKYLIKEGENIEKISFDVYGTPEYYWVIMLINERFDRFYDFPLSFTEFTEYIVDKYGSIAAAQTTYKYYIREAYSKFSTDIGSTQEKQISGATGFASTDLIGSTSEDNSFFIEVPAIIYDFIDPDTNTLRPVKQNGRLMKKVKSMYDIEMEFNEEKRNILLLDKAYISNFVDIFNSLVR